LICISCQIYCQKLRPTWIHFTHAEALQASQRPWRHLLAVNSRYYVGWVSRWVVPARVLLYVMWSTWKEQSPSLCRSCPRRHLWMWVFVVVVYNLLLCLCVSVLRLLYEDRRWHRTLSSDNSRPICSTSDVPMKRRNIHHRPTLLWHFLWFWHRIQNCKLTYLLIGHLQHPTTSDDLECVTSYSFLSRSSKTFPSFFQCVLFRTFFCLSRWVYLTCQFLTTVSFVRIAFSSGATFR